VRAVERAGAQHPDDVGGRDALVDAIDGREEHLATRGDHEDRRLRDAPVLARVENIPLSDDASIGVTQDGERELELAAKTFRLVGAVDGDCDDFGSGGANLIVAIAILRQLAETERSPAPAIKDEHDRPGSNERRQPARYTGRVGELEIRFGAHLALLEGPRQDLLSRAASWQRPAQLW
jgi:hypothetical protein